METLRWKPMDSWYCHKKNRPTGLPPVGSKCVIKDDGYEYIVDVVAHSSYEKDAFFADSENYKGIINLSNGFYLVRPFDPIKDSDNVISLNVTNKRLENKSWIKTLLS